MGGLLFLLLSALLLGGKKGYLFTLRLSSASPTDHGTGCICTVFWIVPAGLCGEGCSRQFSDSPRCKHKRDVKKARCHLGGCVKMGSGMRVKLLWNYQMAMVSKGLQPFERLTSPSYHVLRWCTGIYIIHPGQGI